MVSFTFSAEELRAAPPEVRRWIEAEAAKALGSRFAPEPVVPAPRHEMLAACTPEEMAEVLALISNNLLATRVFFELARESPILRAGAPFHALNLGDLLRHAQLGEPDRLVACLGTINEALQRVRNDAEVSMFGFDDAGHLYLHEATHRSIKEIWERLIEAHAATARPVAEAGATGGPPAGVATQEPAMRPEPAFSSRMPLTGAL